MLVPGAQWRPHVRAQRPPQKIKGSPPPRAAPLAQQSASSAAEWFIEKCRRERGADHAAGEGGGAGGGGGFVPGTAQGAATRGRVGGDARLLGARPEAQRCRWGCGRGELLVPGPGCELAAGRLLGNGSFLELLEN